MLRHCATKVCCDERIGVAGYLSVLALVAAVGIVVALYWLKPPPRTVVVPSSLVWERVLRETHPSRTGCAGGCPCCWPR